VGWLPLADKNIQQILEKYAENQWLKGIRHVVQGEPDPEFILGKEFNRGISLLKNYDLVYDILIFEDQLPNVIRFVDKHPEQQFVLDHIAKPKIKTSEIQPWAYNIKELGKRENVSCKLSGMVTEADYRLWTKDQLLPYLTVVFEAFGPSRLMFGSDWPVCLVAASYSKWLELVKNNISVFSSNEQDLILFKNAQKVYKI
jgi:L-fuconolactonase